VEQDLEQQVAELFPQGPVIAPAKRIVDFVRFLDQIGAKRVVRLGSIPVTTDA
jgi:hypothetical protein